MKKNQQNVSKKQKEQMIVWTLHKNINTYFWKWHKNWAKKKKIVRVVRESWQKSYYMKVAPILDRFSLRIGNPKDNTLPSVFRSVYSMTVLNFEIRFACCFIDILEWERREEKKIQKKKRNLPYYSNQSPNKNHFCFLCFPTNFCFAMFSFGDPAYNSLIYWHSYILLL